MRNEYTLNDPLSMVKESKVKPSIEYTKLLEAAEKTMLESAEIISMLKDYEEKRRNGSFSESSVSDDILSTEIEFTESTDTDDIFDLNIEI